MRANTWVHKDYARNEPTEGMKYEVHGFKVGMESENPQFHMSAWCVVIFTMR